MSPVLCYLTLPSFCFQICRLVSEIIPAISAKESERESTNLAATSSNLDSLPVEFILPPSPLVKGDTRLNVLDMMGFLGNSIILILHNIDQPGHGSIGNHFFHAWCPSVHPENMNKILR